MSTIGDAPVTVTVSLSAPTRISAFNGTVTFDATRIPSRLTLANPSSVNVTTYWPGRSSTMLYRPSALVTTVRDFSMSSGLDASTATPGSTAPLVSVTNPAIVLCAAVVRGSTERTVAKTAILTSETSLVRIPFLQWFDAS